MSYLVRGGRFELRTAGQGRARGRSCARRHTRQGTVPYAVS